MSTKLANSPLLSVELPNTVPWAPAYYTKPMGTQSRGYELTLFARTFLIASRGRKGRVGKPIKLTAWQTWLINNFMELDAEGNLRYREILWMVPRKNGKTFIAAMLVLYHLVTAPGGAEIYSAAGSRDQARLVFEEVSRWVFKSPALQKILRVRDSVNRIENRQTGSYYRALSSDAGKAHGLAPYFSVLDEVHTWDGESRTSKRRAQELYNALQKGSADRDESQMLLISTAGDFVNDSLLGSIYKRGIEVAAREEASGSFGFFCWQASESDNPLELSTWKKANPNLAEGILKESVVRDNLEASVQISINTFLRDHLNIWASAFGEPYIQPVVWDAAEWQDGDPFAPGASISVGFDASKRGDSTGIVIQDIETGVIKVWDLWEKPEGADATWHIKRSAVEGSMMKLHELYDVQAIWADSFYYEAELRSWIDDHGWDIELVPQTRGRKDRYATEFRQDLIEGLTFYIDDDDLNRHIQNTIMDRRESFSKPPGSSRQKIDLFVAAMLANAGRNFLTHSEEDDPDYFVRIGR